MFLDLIARSSLARTLESGARVACVPALVLAIGACGRSAETPEVKATASSVELPSTPVDDQGRFGICWAYGTTGLIESLYKAKTGRDVNLSEEAIAFYHLAEMLLATIQASGSVANFITDTRFGLNEGYFARLSPETRKTHSYDAFDLVEKYGVVPESSWRFKIVDDAQRSSLLSALRRNIIRLAGERNLHSLTVDDVIDRVMTGEGGFPSAPPRSLSWEGQEVSAQSFAQDLLEFRPSEFVAVDAHSEAQLGSWIQLIKSSLAAGYAVPLGFPINVLRLEGGETFGADGVSPDDSLSFAQDGGHLVLATDFINEGGQRGFLPSDLLQAELEKAPTELEAFVFKNSWGVGSKEDETGQTIGYSPDGYYRITRDYLVGAARAATKGYIAPTAVVPRSIFESKVWESAEGESISHRPLGSGL